MTHTAAQQAALTELKMLFQVDEDLYRSRSHFRLKDNEFVHLNRRISLTYEDTYMAVDADVNGVLHEYEDNRSAEFYYDVWFNNWGHVWFLISETSFPQFGKDIAYWHEHDQYDWKTCGRGSRRYFFSDVISCSVRKAFEAQLAGLTRHFVWNHSEIAVITYEEKIDAFWDR
jgi:hypothetical protein